MLCVSLLCTMILLMLLAVLLIRCFIRLFLIYLNVTTSLTKFMMTWCFQTVVLEKTLESPLNNKEIKTADPKRNQSSIVIGRTVLKLKFQYFGHLMQRADSLEKTLMQGKIEGRRRRGRQRMLWWMASPTQWTWVRANSGRWWRTGKPGMLQFIGSQRVGHNSDLTKTTIMNDTESCFMCLKKKKV